MAKKKLDKEAERTPSSPELPTRVLSTVEIRQTCQRSTIM